MTDQPVAGWYPDPSGDPSKLRYWDGTQWTNDFANAQPSYPTGGPANPANPGGPAAQPYYGQAVPAAGYVQSNNDTTLRLIAFILCIVSTVSVCWAIIPLAWMIPMTVRCWGIYKGTKPNTTAFGVCTLIFVSIIGGILLLVSKKDA